MRNNELKLKKISLIINLCYKLIKKKNIYGSFVFPIYVYYIFCF